MRCWNHIKYFKLLIISVLIGCGVLNNDKNDTFKNPVYANVYFEETRPNSGAPIQGLIAINYDNPKEFKLLSSDSTAFRNIRLSPDGDIVSYSDYYSTEGPAPWLGVYNTGTESRELLVEKTYNAPLVGNSAVGVVWNTKSTGFYYTNAYQPFRFTNAVLYYDLKTETTRTIKEASGKSIIPRGLIGGDTLIVNSNEFDTLAYYAMSLEGEYLNRIDNPCLEYLNTTGVIERGVLDLAWNDSLKMFAGYYINEEQFEGYKIAVTDWAGNVCKEFTNGNYLNTSPRWMKDGKILFTEQRDVFNELISELKLLDPETGEITPFFSSQEYPEITGVGNADQ